MATLIPLKVVDANENSPPIAAKPPSRIIKVGFVQLNNSFSDQYYLPLSVGMLQAYAKKHLAHPKSYEFSIPIHQFMRIEEASELLSDNDVVGFSSYVWNEQNTLAIARDYKRRKPNGIVVFGGPQVPDSKKQFRRVRTDELTPEELKSGRIHFTEDYHRANPHIDVSCHGEGERIFRYILEQMAIDSCYDKSRIPSTSYLDANGNFHFNNKLERMGDKELANTPSPFTTGVFDKLMNAFPFLKWIKNVETNRGCPYTCTYCDWGGATEDRIAKFLLEQMYADIMWGGEHEIPYEFVCDANFGIFPRDIQIAEFYADCKSKYGFLEGVSTQNAKNPKKHTIEALKILQRAGLNKAAVMSQQSLNPATLRAVERDNMKLDEYLEMQNMAAKEGIYTMTDIIPGMPEETFESIVDAISTLITNGQHNRIQFNNLSVLKNTKMANREYQERYAYEIVRSKIINTHGKKMTSISGIDEWQELVLGTNTMPGETWLRTRTFCWATGLFYFNKLLQIPIITLNQECGLEYGKAIKLRCEDFQNYGNFQVLTEIRQLFLQTAEDMRKGGDEFIHSSQWLDIYWPPEEYALIKLCVENKLEAFYQEAEQVISLYLAQAGKNIPTSLLKESITLNRSLMKVPFQSEDIKLNLSYNVWNIYKSVLVGKKIKPRQGRYRYTIDRTTERWNSWEEWCEKMVWWGNRQGAYLYGNKNPHQEIAGHY